MAIRVRYHEAAASVETGLLLDLQPGETVQVLDAGNYGGTETLYKYLVFDTVTPAPEDPVHDGKVET